VAVLTAAWPYKLGLMAAALVGILVGFGLESRGGHAKRQLPRREEAEG
jgi:hypothetical protein